MVSLDNKKAKRSAPFRSGKGTVKRQPPSLATRSKAVGVVRIVGGKFKRSVLPVEDREGLRPTPERVRETLFDWLTHLTGGLSGLCVCDMFAGSGALGLEAASRGAHQAVILEKDRRGAARIQAVVDKLSAGDIVQVCCVDSFLWLKTTDKSFDIIFIDPPFDAKLHAKATQSALERLKPDGMLYMENDALLDDEWLATLGLIAVRRGKAGAVYYLLAERKTV